MRGHSWIARLSYTIVIISSASVVISALLYAQEQQPGQPPNGFRDLNDAAFAARTNELREIRVLTDTILDRFAIISMPKDQPLRDRIARAEYGFRRGLQRPISEQDAVAALNQMARYALAPEWARTNLAQIHLFRTMLKPKVPQLVGQLPVEPAKDRHPYWTISDKMSPAEAVFVVTYLARGKIFSPEYQVGPDEWVDNIRRMMTGRTEKPSVVPFATLLSPEMTRLLHIAEHGLTNYSSGVSVTANDFLDMMKVLR
jgi:hypothetical protein